MRETEILFFLVVIIMIRSRKTGNVSMINYLSNGFMYAKVANTILFFMADPRLGLVYALLFLLQGLLLPEPTYKGPEDIVYFRNNTLSEEINRDKNVVWMITFYAAWSPACIDFASIFSKISSEYGLANLKFGKVDVGRFAEVAEEYHINTSSLSRQLPTLIMFQVRSQAASIYIHSIFLFYRTARRWAEFPPFTMEKFKSFFSTRRQLRQLLI